MLFIAWCIKRYINTNEITQFTLSIVSLVGIALLIGLFENSSIIAALNPNHTSVWARKFSFANCWLGIVTTQDIHNMVTYTAMLIIATKYHSVAKQIDSVLQDGVLLSNRKMKVHKYPYIGFGVINVIVTLILIILHAHYKRKYQTWRHNSNVTVLSLTWAVIGIIFLTISFSWSTHMMRKTAKQASAMQTTLNTKMFVINIIFYLVFIISEIVYYIGYTETLDLGFLVTQFFYELSRLALESLIMYLALLFGRSVNVKSQITQSGDLIILGENELKQEYFTFHIKQMNANSLDDLDSDSSVGEDELSIYDDTISALSNR